jgi:hypothetical protein
MPQLFAHSRPLSRFRISQFEAASGTSINNSLFISANNIVSHAERNCLQCSRRFVNGFPVILESPRNDSMDDNSIVSTLQQFMDFLCSYILIGLTYDEYPFYPSHG